MAFSFKSTGHFLATAFSVLSKVKALEPIVGMVTTLVPGGAPIVAIERTSFAVLGVIASLLAVGDQVTKTKLTDAGFDQVVIAQVEDLLKRFPTLITLAKAL